MEIKLSLSLPRDEISIPVVRKICTQSLIVLGVIRECIDDVELALTEACANVLIHAQIEDEYEVSVGVDNEVAVIEVSDRGGGFDPTVDPNQVVTTAGEIAHHDGTVPDGADSLGTGGTSGVGSGDDSRGNDDTDGLAPDSVPEQGRGIFLMKALMDQVQFHRVDGPHRGTRVHLEKVLAWEESAPGARLSRPRTPTGPWGTAPTSPTHTPAPASPATSAPASSSPASTSSTVSAPPSTTASAPAEIRGFSADSEIADRAL